MRNIHILLLTIVIFLTLCTGCGKKQQSEAAVKNETPMVTVQEEKKKDESLIQTARITIEKVTGENEYSFTGVITGYDADGKQLWQWISESVCETELELLEEIGLRDSGYWFICNGTIYCIGISGTEAGQILWKNDDFGGGSAHWTFDDAGDLWICGGYGPELMHISKAGETISKLETFGEEYSDCYWPVDLTLDENGAIKIRYESNSIGLLFDPETLKVLERIPVEEINLGNMLDFWYGITWEIEGDEHIIAEEDAEAGLIVNQDGTFDFVFKTRENEESFYQVPYEIKYGYLYPGIENSSGPYYLYAEIDVENTVQFAITKPDTVEMIWYRGVYTDDSYPAALSVIFERLEEYNG